MRLPKLHETLFTVDYQFRKNYLGQPVAKFSMGHEAFGRWFSDELSSNKLLAQQINRSIDDIQSGLAFEKA
ncbi:MAG: YacL family protein, partial [Kangiellaceae bacterium]|nr:YacL family protein [Kangiellaceae bacterium]